MDGRTQSLEQTPHLAPALAAIILGVVALEVFGLFARFWECHSIAALAASEAVIKPNGKLAPVKNQGAALQRAALDAGCLLPVYGSSELNLLVAYNRPFHPTSVFRDRPTGFTAFPFGRRETTCLLILQKLAAVGPALHGRKVVISLSPYWFVDRLAAREDGYAGNFSELHAGELAFATCLSLQLRQDVARRMIQFPSTLANRPLLRFALENLADGSPLGLACYDAVLPLIMLHNAIAGYQDHWAVVRYLWRNRREYSTPALPRRAAPPDWPRLYQQADAVHRAHCNNNEFGLDNEKWDLRIRQMALALKNTRSDEEFLQKLERSQEWIDLELLLRALGELGARPLLLSMPIHGGWYDQAGISSSARRAYYEKLRRLAARYHTPVVDFADHDADRSFTNDSIGHLAPKGTVAFSQVFDRFFHDAIPLQPELPPAAPLAVRQTDAAGEKTHAP